jgi:hypothetical protein
MNVDLALLLMDDNAIPSTPQASDSIRMDTFFEDADFGLEPEVTVFVKRDSLGRRWLGKAWSQPGQ